MRNSDVICADHDYARGMVDVPYRALPAARDAVRLASAAGIVLGAAVLTGCFPSPTPPAPTPTPSPSSVVVDEYASYYDELSPAVALVAPASMWGSFGPEDATQPAFWMDQSQPPGDLTVVLECVGAETLDLRFAEGDAPPSHTTPSLLEVNCPSTTITQVTTVGEGFAVEVDSHGQTGAFRVSVTSTG